MDTPARQPEEARATISFHQRQDFWAHSSFVMEGYDRKPRFPRPGGTSGGLGEFVTGFLMAMSAVYLLTSNVTVSSGYWQLWGYNAMGLSLVPLILGIGLLFFNGKSPGGWLFLAAGLIIIISSIVMNLHFYFQPTSLFNTLIMLGLLAGGLGLLARGLQGH